MRTKRSLLIGIGIVVALAVAVSSFGVRPLSQLVDRISTARVDAMPATPIGWNGSVLFIGSHMKNLQAPGFTTAAQVRVDSGNRLVLTAGGRSFTLGTRDGDMRWQDGSDIPAFAAEPGDETLFTRERSWLCWPTPFEMNFMTGHSPSWRRVTYQRLVWTKRSGARLEMLWRFEQPFYPGDGWMSAEMTREDWSGLIRVTIRPDC